MILIESTRAIHIFAGVIYEELDMKWESNRDWEKGGGGSERAKNKTNQSCANGENNTPTTATTTNSLAIFIEYTKRSTLKSKKK